MGHCRVCIEIGVVVGVESQSRNLNCNPTTGRYGTLRESVTELLRNLVGRYGRITEVLRSVMEPLHRPNVIGALASVTGCRRALQNIMERCWTLRDVTKCYGSVMGPLQNVTEPLWKISILPIRN